MAKICFNGECFSKIVFNGVSIDSLGFNGDIINPIILKYYNATNNDAGKNQEHTIPWSEITPTLTYEEVVKAGGLTILKDSTINRCDFLGICTSDDVVFDIYLEVGVKTLIYAYLDYSEIESFHLTILENGILINDSKGSPSRINKYNFNFTMAT